MPKKIKEDKPPPVPRKRKNLKKEQPPTISQEEHVVIQLPISSERAEDILKSELLNPLEYCANIIDPEPYTPSNNFISHNDTVIHAKKEASQKQDEIHTPLQIIDKETIHSYTNCCYWCCHQIGVKEFGLPIKYDTVHDNFTTFGCFCSLECVVAYNCSHYMGSDRMWEINSWVQWMAQKMGYEPPIRPAPSRYLLKMFNGTMDIEEFREVHKTYLKTYIMNMPPLIHTHGQMEIINTSYLNQKTVTTTTTTTDHFEEKVKLCRNSSVMDKRKTLDSKMNLTIKTIK